MNKKKGIAVAVVLLLILLIGGMLAYFTDSDTEDNVFTLGKNIDIELSESLWDTTDTTGVHGVPDAAEDIHPGTKLPKNPVITNDANAAQAYVFAEVIVPCYDDGYTGTGTITVDQPLFSLDGAPTGTETLRGWTLLRAEDVDTDTRTKTYIYYYGNATDGMTILEPNTSTDTVFNSITLDSTLTAEEAATAIIPPANPGDPVVNPEVKVNAYAIQTDGYGNKTPAEIFALYTNQNNPNP